MSKTLTYDIPEELYEAFDHIAQRDGKTTEQVALEYLARRAAERHRRAFAVTSARHISDTRLALITKALIVTSLENTATPTRRANGLFGW